MTSIRGWIYAAVAALALFGLQFLIGETWGFLAQIPLLVAAPFLGSKAYMIGSDQDDRRRWS